MTNNISASGKFESHVRSLLKDLGFTKVKGGPNFSIGDNQIDACGVCDNKMVIIECTTQRTYIRSKIENWKGKQASIRRGLDEFKAYRELNQSSRLAFVLASKYSIIDGYRDFARNSPKVTLWDSRLISYYEKIAKAIPFRAKYDVLTELDFELEEDETIKIPAFRVKFDGTEMYNFFMSPEELIKISYVARRETGRRDFYQRIVDPTRLSKITKFIKKGGIFPTNIVVGISKKIDFEEIEAKKKDKTAIPSWLSFGRLKFPKSYQSCWIIDGQHRLFSFKKGMKQKLPVVAFANIDLDKQARFFVHVNKYAKPISSRLLWDLEGDLRPESKEGIISNAVKIVNTQEPFIGEISIPSIGSGPISIATFCDSLMKKGFADRLIKTGRGKYIVRNPFYSKNYAEFSKNIANSVSLYFKGTVDLINPQKDYVKELIFNSGGVSVLVYLYKILICVEGKKASRKMVSKYLTPVVDYLSTHGKSLINDYKKKCSSEGGKKLVLSDLLKLLVTVNEDISDYIEERIELSDRLIELESRLRKVIEIELQKKDFDWIKRHIDGELVRRVRRKIKVHTDNKTRDFCNELTMGGSSLIITKDLWNKIFKKVFVRDESITAVGDLRFPNEDLFRAHWKMMVFARNQLLHDRQYVFTTKDKESLQNFLDRITDILERYYKV